MGRESTIEQQVTNRAGQSNDPADIVSRVWIEFGLSAVRPNFRTTVNNKLRQTPEEHIEIAARYFAADKTAVALAENQEAVFLCSWQKYVAAWQAGEKEGVRAMPYQTPRPPRAVNDWQRTPGNRNVVAPARRLAPEAPVVPARRLAPEAPVVPARRLDPVLEVWRRRVVEIAEEEGKDATGIPPHFVPEGFDLSDEKALEDACILYALEAANMLRKMQIPIEDWKDVYAALRAAEVEDTQK